jgi:release factor glutamine methyltransferase
VVRLVELLAEATTQLAAAHVPSPRVDAELLAAHVLELARGRLLSASDLTDDQVKKYRELVRRRADRVPLQHLTGTAPFRHLQLRVGPGVFVPRPETELLVEWGLEWLLGRTGCTVVDLCAGSGAIAGAIATETTGHHVFAIERDAGAWSYLRDNVGPAGVVVIGADVLEPRSFDGTVDLVLCNPPYVPEIGRAGLPPEVTEHDPHNAVFGGTDGLQLIRPLIGRIAAILRPGGAFAIEHDDTHAYVVPTLVDADGRFEKVELHHDLARRPRFTTATRAGGAG